MITRLENESDNDFWKRGGNPKGFRFTDEQFEIAREKYTIDEVLEILATAHKKFEEYGSANPNNKVIGYNPDTDTVTGITIDEELASLTFPLSRQDMLKVFGVFNDRYGKESVEAAKLPSWNKQTIEQRTEKYNDFFLKYANVTAAEFVSNFNPLERDKNANK